LREGARSRQDKTQNKRRGRDSAPTYVALSKTTLGRNG
jgi:hypothetical protein